MAQALLAKRQQMLCHVRLIMFGLYLTAFASEYCDFNIPHCTVSRDARMR
jgi:hypothetical protein